MDTDSITTTSSIFTSLFKRKTPLLTQTEISECGLVCVAMISGYHQQHISVHEIRQRSEQLNLSKQGNNLSELVRLANCLNLEAQALQGEIDELSEVSLPCILHWDMKHFVVLDAIQGRGSRARFIINDPARGRQTLSYQEMSAHFTGVVLTLTPQQDFTQNKPKPALKLSQLWSSSQGLVPAMVNLFGLSLVLQLVMLASPYYMQFTIDHVLQYRATDLMNLLLVGFIGVTLFGSAMQLLRSWLMVRLNTELAFAFGQNVMRHLLHLPAMYFMNRHLGDIQSRFDSIHAIRERIASGVLESVMDGLLLVILIAVMLWYSVPLTLVVIGALLLYLALRMAFYGPLKRYSQRLLEKQADETSTFIDIIKHWRTRLLYNKQCDNQREWTAQYCSTLREDVKMQTLQLSFATVQKTLFALTHLIVIYIAANQVMEQALTMGMMMAFVAYQQQVIERGGNLIEQLLQFKLLSVHLTRIADITHYPQEPHCLGHGQSEPHNNQYRGHLRLDNISYTYPGASKPTIENVSVDIPAGRSLVITGESGVGKTTLLHIMLGLLQPSQGRVLLDGVDITQMGLFQYRANIAAVLQNDTLMRGTILDNVCLHSEQVDMPKIQRVLQQAQLWQVVSRLPMGLNTHCGELGVTLSGGQIQRLLLARALYHSPTILFLDEATSQLDAQNESTIAQTISALPMTRIMVAHRAETIKHSQYRLCLANAKTQLLPQNV